MADSMLIISKYVESNKGVKSLSHDFNEETFFQIQQTKFLLP
jgi:hypothetical protein